jgi:hypothetical protein
MPRSSIDTRDDQRPIPRQGFGRREFLGAGVAAVAIRSPFAYGDNQPHTYCERFETPVVARHQVVVAGGGPSGLIAAIAAARSGADTLLVERHAFLGGTGTAELVSWYNGFRARKVVDGPQLVRGIPAEFIAEIARLRGIANPDFSSDRVNEYIAGNLPYQVRFDPEAAKIAAWNMIEKDGVKLRLHSWIVGPMLDGSRVTGILVESKSGRQGISADVVVDATGDGDLAVSAGAPFVESENTLPMCLMYRLGGEAEADAGSPGAEAIGRRLAKSGPSFRGSGRDIDTLTRAEVETRLQLWGRIEDMRKRKGGESAFLLQTGTGIGVRETRHVVGDYVIGERDVTENRQFEDAIATTEHIQVPYRSLLPKTIDGLVLTGRCISSERQAFKATHLGAPTLALGHASGCAAALAALGNVLPRNVDVGRLRETLLAQKAVV